MTNNYQLQTMFSGNSYAPAYQDKGVNETAIITAEASYALAEQAAFRDKLFSALTKQVLDNTAALATSEAYYNQIAPSGREEYRFILQAYARLAMEAVWGGVR